MWAASITHPAASFRNPNLIGPIMAHVNGFVRRGLNGPSLPPRLEEAPSLDRLMWLAKVARRKKLPLSIDVEAAPPSQGREEWALLPAYARLRVVGIGIDYDFVERGTRYHGLGMSWHFPFPDARTWRYFKKLMDDPTYEIVYMNGEAYDRYMLERHGVRFHRLEPFTIPSAGMHDIRDRRRAMVSTSRTSLAAQTSYYEPGIPAWKVEAVEDDGDEKGLISVARIPRRTVLRYNAEDCVRAAQCDGGQRRELRADPEDRARIERLYRQGRRLALVGAEMSIKGFPVNEQRRRWLSHELTRIAREKAEEVASLVRPFAKVKVLKPGEDGADYKGYFRISANGGVNKNDLSALLFKETRKPGIESFNLEVPFSPKCRTESGAPSVDRDSLLILFIQDNTPQEVKEICKAAWRADSPLKARNTFVDSKVVLSRIGPDGRMHPSINTCAAETGRWTCSDPNLFNLSEAVEEAANDPRGVLPNVRQMYEAEDGYVIVHRDFKQVELEVIYDVTQDELLGQLIASGDVHTATVRKWFSRPDHEEVPKGLRHQAKTVRFSSNYGAGVEMVYLKVLAKMPDAEFDDIHALWSLFRDPVVGHAGIVYHWERAREHAESKGYNETRIMKRRRYYPPGPPIKITEPLNYEVQGTAADIANSTMVGMDDKDYPKSLHGQLKRHFPSAWLAMHTYDSFDVICKKRDAAAINRLMEDVMSGPWDAGRGLRIFKSDGKIDRNWGNV